MITATGSNAELAAPAVPFSARTPMVRPVALHRWAHDADAYTQGLLVHNGRLYEGTGLEGRSEMRYVMLRTGEIVLRTPTPDAAFGEGIAVVRGRLYQLTWRRGRGAVYSLDSLRIIDSVRYDGEGWGLTADGTNLYLSDGTSRIRVIDPAGFAVTRVIDVTEAGMPVRFLNELEWVRGELWANVYKTNLIARINPASGVITGWLDVSELLSLQERTVASTRGGTANGIAYDAATNRVLLTGKLWPWLFEVAVPK
ncbi:glutaminyl-peptide cyclotransferase [Gemmatimonas groenlandica]|uniref:Glutaminyl-peptide cyclotransferase n=1 Tax=Gemmatimonas groenlandica TaxID=2732249 RepID=A0A6M4IRU7_9BACT|nr:glutaminyl-peptide cyclotransferase [Gemmatimonas groenlandica]QJR35562.1 glutaminyl-peptide cyclotransferase [Gemmatimonas groenlandica]